MRIPRYGISMARASLCAAAMAGLISAGWSQAQPPTPAVGQSAARETKPVHAAWAPRSLRFTYRGVTTRYTCNGLQQKLRHMLTMLGARDVSVRGFGCINSYAPEPAPSVNIRMQVLVLAPAEPVSSGATVPARWQWTDLLARRDPAEVSADCELVQQFRQSILPLFGPRNIDYHSICVPRAPIPGTVRLRAEVLTQR